MMPHARPPRARGHRQRAEDHRRERDPGRLVHPFVDADRVAAGDVAELVGDDALHLLALSATVSRPEWR